MLFTVICFGRFRGYDVVQLFSVHEIAPVPGLCCGAGDVSRLGGGGALPANSRTAKTASGGPQRAAPEPRRAGHALVWGPDAPTVGSLHEVQPGCAEAQAELHEAVGCAVTPELLELLVTREMSFGKYKGRLVADLPGHYLAWFAREGFPKGQLGQLLALMHELDHNDLRVLLEPLRRRS